MECSFAHQEAKLDQLLNLLTTKQTVDLPATQPSHNHQQPVQQFSTPVPSQSVSTVPLSTPMSAGGPSRSLEIPMPMLFQQTPLVDLDRLLDDPELTGNISSFKVSYQLLAWLTVSWARLQKLTIPNSLIPFFIIRKTNQWSLWKRDYVVNFYYWASVVQLNSDLILLKSVKWAGEMVVYVITTAEWIKAFLDKPLWDREW